MKYFRIQTYITKTSELAFVHAHFASLVTAIYIICEPTKGNNNIIFLMLYVACVLLRYVYAYNLYTYAYEYHDENQAVNLVLYNWMGWSMD